MQRTHPDQGSARRIPRTVKAALVAAAVLVIAGIWVWAFAAARQPPPGMLTDERFAASAEQVCAATSREVAELPPAFEATQAAQRAEVVERSNSIYSAMIADLASLLPADERDAAMVEEWLLDWNSYIADRADYASRLRTDEAARFYVSAKGGDQVTEPVDRFARINGMLACATPSDLS